MRHSAAAALRSQAAQAAQRPGQAPPARPVSAGACRKRYALLLTAIVANVLFMTLLVGSGAFPSAGGFGGFSPPRHGTPPPPAERSLEDALDIDSAPDPYALILKLLDRPLRVAIVTHEMARSGAAMMCLELANMLHRRGANVSIVVLFSEVPGSAREQSLLISPGHPYRVSEDGAELFKGLYSAQRYDLVVASSAAAATVNWVHRFRKRNKDYGRLLWWVHEGPAVMNEFPVRFAAEAVDAMRLGHADGLIFESWHSAEWWLQKVSESRTRLVAPFSRVVHWGLPQSKIDAIAAATAHAKRAVAAAAAAGGQQLARKGAGADASRGFAAWPRVIRERITGGDQVRVFIMVANGNPRKGHEGAFEAIRLANAQCGEATGGPRLRLLGVGVTSLTAERSSSEDLYSLAGRYGALVELMTEKVDPLPLLAASDAFVSNGISGGENFGLSLMEAMAAGVPVLATRAGGATEQVVHNVHGFLYSTGEDGRGRYKLGANAAALAAAMCIVVRQPERAAAWGAAGQARVRAYLSERRIMHEFGAMLLSVLQLPPRDPDSSLPLPEPDPALAPLTVKASAQWPLVAAGAADPRDRWIAAAALPYDKAAQGKSPAGTTTSTGGTGRGVLVGRHPVYVLTPAASRGGSAAGVPPDPSLKALDPLSGTLQPVAAAGGVPQPDWPRAGASMAGGVAGSSGGELLVIAGGVHSVTDPCSTGSASAWAVVFNAGSATGGEGVVFRRLPELPEQLVRPALTVVTAAEELGHGAIHVFGGAPVTGDRAVSALHWRIATEVAGQQRAAAAAAAAASSNPAPPSVPTWERLPDVPMPALEASTVAISEADERGEGSATDTAAVYVLGGYIGGPSDPLVLGPCAPPAPTTKEEEEEEDEPAGAGTGAEAAADAEEDAGGRRWTLLEKKTKKAPVRPGGSGTGAPLKQSPDAVQDAGPPPHPLYGSAVSHARALAMSTVLRYDVRARRWAVVADLPVPVWGASAAVHAGRILLLGGHTTGGILTDALQQYVPRADRWHVVEQTPLAVPSAGGVSWLGWSAPPPLAPGVSPAAAALALHYLPVAFAECRDLLRQPSGPQLSPKATVPAAQICRPGDRPWPAAAASTAVLRVALAIAAAPAVPAAAVAGKAARASV